MPYMYGRSFSSEPKRALSMSGPCSIRFDSGSPTFVLNSLGRTEGLGCRRYPPSHTPPCLETPTNFPRIVSPQLVGRRLPSPCLESPEPFPKRLRWDSPSHGGIGSRVITCHGRVDLSKLHPVLREDAEMSMGSISSSYRKPHSTNLPRESWCFPPFEHSHQGYSSLCMRLRCCRVTYE